MTEYRGMKARIPTDRGKVTANLYRNGNEIYGNLTDGGTVRIVPTLENGQTKGWKIAELKRGD